MKPKLTDGTEKKWAIFVEGYVIDDSYYDFKTASELAQKYVYSGRSSVTLYQYNTGEEVQLG